MPESGHSQTSLVGIGVLLRHLQPEFPGLSASKIRFLEDQGLVRPHRTASGYRKYSEEDIERLATVLRLQQERYLPLKVIRDRLERGEDPGADAEPQEPRETERATSSVHGQESQDPRQAVAHPVRQSGRRYTLREVAARTGTETALLRDLMNNGWLVERSGYFDDYALTVAATAKRLSGYGIEPRHLRALRGASERMIGLVEGTIAPLISRRDPTSREKAPQRAREIASLCLTMTTALVNSQLKDTLRPFEQER
ncbi:MerR family transcriptional regulator [Kocuria sp. cx-455]|uniref:transcriptional regulator FtsR n=1 Tax=unclassified Candidatus Sulfotelmatobacter TaxID=2635724 RepID=UPI001684B3C9|nr:MULTISPECIES: MerR family transcriptional regulator [unclassified Candidatus Sulfotelmatobacter]MBD2763403.1 MerR family transcriptional regulator [Kocuria sp. cx-116]MBD2765627.1 MerR family transcriptional regulator [Kocuria sp. cx-455]